MAAFKAEIPIHPLGDQIVQTHTSNNILTNLNVLPDPDDMDIAVGISLLCIASEETRVTEF